MGGAWQLTGEHVIIMNQTKHKHRTNWECQSSVTNQNITQTEVTEPWHYALQKKHCIVIFFFIFILLQLHTKILYIYHFFLIILKKIVLTVVCKSPSQSLYLDNPYICRIFPMPLLWCLGCVLIVTVLLEGQPLAHLRLWVL